MQSPRVAIRRMPYEEPHNIHLEFVVSSGPFSGAVDVYFHRHEMEAIAARLKVFPVHVGDEYIFEYGSESPSLRAYRHLVLRAYCVDQVGHCALQFSINLNQAEPEEGVVRFSIPVEPAALNRLGELLEVFAQLRHLELVWSPITGALYEQYQEREATVGTSEA